MLVFEMLTCLDSEMLTCLFFEDVNMCLVMCSDSDCCEISLLIMKTLVLLRS